MISTFSSLDRVEKCPASAVLPPVRFVADETPKDAAGAGTVAHAFLRDVSLNGYEAALEAAPVEFRQALADVDLSSLPACEPDAYAAEVALAYDYAADTGRELHRGKGNRDYSSAKPTEICGTIDVLGLTADAVIALDYKTGYRWLGPAAEALQLLTAALAACRAHNRRKAHVGFIRVLPDGEVRFIRADLDMLDLDAAAERLRAIVAAVEHPRAAWNVAEGSHCRYCPAFSNCPAKKNLAASIMDAEVAIPALDAQTLPRVLERLEAAEEVLKKVRAAVEEFATATPVVLPDGAVYGAVETTRETIDPLKGAAVLGAAYGDQVATESVEQTPTLTKKALGEALRAWVKANPGNKIGKTIEAAEELLRSKGAISTSVYTVVRRVYPKALKPGKAA